MAWRREKAQVLVRRLQLLTTDSAATRLNDSLSQHNSSPHSPCPHSCTITSNITEMGAYGHLEVLENQAALAHLHLHTCTTVPHLSLCPFLNLNHPLQNYLKHN